MSFLVVKIISGAVTYNAEPISYGRVDIRPQKYDLASERRVLEISNENSGSNINLNTAVRCAIIVNASNKELAVEEADAKISDALDARSCDTLFPSPWMFSSVGFTKNLETGEIREISQPFKLGTSFERSRFVFEPAKFGQLALYESATNRLAKALLRAKHWDRISIAEKNMVLKLGSKWISLETLTKITPDDDIVPRIMLSIGFLTGRAERDVTTDFRKEATNFQNYRVIKQRTFDALIRLRNIRNELFHEGLRATERPALELMKLDILVSVSVNSVLGLAKQALSLGVMSKEELWENASAVLELHRENTLVRLNDSIPRLWRVT